MKKAKKKALRDLWNTTCSEAADESHFDVCWYHTLNKESAIRAFSKVQLMYEEDELCYRFVL